MKSTILSFIDKHTVFGVETTEQFVITNIQNQKVRVKKVWEAVF